ncbi:hypothetical protein CJ030_MR5G009768 [Morella rubra]|uniref:Uncharacterized protein n=1 Tax=Morella rubra TaxID=262757 RepID=A0A6A1VLI4_9ROSI|nr:hypothetical protein CJ030_MR5G009768 [Morella rubra]
MATTSSALPEQQQQQPGETLTSPQAVTTNAWQSSGSIGPFFAVISVLTVLAILSCVLGRLCARRARDSVTPLEIVSDAGCFGWAKRKCRQCMAGDVDVGAKTMAFGRESNDCKVKDGDVQHPPQG